MQLGYRGRYGGGLPSRLGGLCAADCGGPGYCGAVDSSRVDFLLPRQPAT